MQNKDDRWHNHLLKIERKTKTKTKQMNINWKFTWIVKGIPIPWHFYRRMKENISESTVFNWYCNQLMKRQKFVSQLFTMTIIEKKKKIDSFPFFYFILCAAYSIPDDNDNWSNSNLKLPCEESEVILFSFYVFVSIEKLKEMPKAFDSIF